ncbi:PilZ domain-containing protein [uncultured Azohydromonas sp.]|jgi:PilZ domain.|uniref:PilZ domain-containing protein n=1 Tax=uncultured Azohydromonas sp. TaxID=487342 RepID=UPI002638F98A|nr:PilZ domain-containing protein [uncultured Azohydromonas sp.]
MPLTDDEMTALRAGADRRKFKRTLYRSHARLLLPDLDAIEVRTVDISSGGVGIVSPLNLLPGTPCEIHLRFRKIPIGMENVAMQAQVAYCVLSGREQGFLSGIQFVEPSREALKAIDRYIRSIPEVW